MNENLKLSQEALDSAYKAVLNNAMVKLNSPQALFNQNHSTYTTLIETKHKIVCIECKEVLCEEVYCSNYALMSSFRCRSCWQLNKLRE